MRLTGLSGLTYGQEPNASICLDSLRTVVSALEGDGAKTRVAKSHEAVERERGTPATNSLSEAGGGRRQTNGNIMLMRGCHQGTDVKE